MARKSGNLKSTTRDPQSKDRVWRFVDYEGRFSALADMRNMKQTVPQYLRWYVNAWEGCGGEVLVALNRLRGERDFIWLQGAVIELLTAATNTSPEYQGYLLTSRKEPMEASEVGSMLRVDGRRARGVLTRLKNVGFLETVAWPLNGSDGPIPDDPSLRLLQDVAKASRKGRGKAGEKRGWRCQNAGPPETKVETIEPAAQQTIEVTAGGRDAPPPQGGQTVQCPNCGHAANVPSGTKLANCTKCGQVVNLGNRGKARQASTSTTSTIPDAGAGLGSRSRGDPSRKAGPPSVIRIGDVLPGQGHRYSAEANAFGEQVLAACGYCSSDPAEFVNEVAHFAKLWEQAAADLTADGIERMKAKVFRVAANVRSRRAKYERPEAYMETTVQNAIRDQKRAHRAQTA